MKRFTILLIAVVSTVLVITVVATSNFSSVATSNFSPDDRHPGHHQEKNKGQGSTPSVDGSVNPELIPDDAAYEILFRLLSTNNPNENDAKASQRKSAYLRVTGFSDAEAAAISNAAYEYKRQIDPMDTEVDNIKNQHWPHPDLKVMGQLKQKQKEKEDIISGLESSLKGQLNNYNGSAKLDKHITGRIKKKTKGFIVGLPTKKISGIGGSKKIFSIGDYFSNLFTVSAQAPGCDTSIYIYADTILDMVGFMAYGSTSYSVPYNNCGHSITLNSNLNGDYNMSFSLDFGDHFQDGFFQTQAIADSYCPVVNQSFYGGENSDTEYQSAFVSLGPYQACTPTGNVNLNNVYACTLKATGSNDSGGKSFTISVGHEIVSGSFNMSSNSSPTSGTFPNNGPHQPKEVLIAVIHDPISLNSGSSAQFKGVTNIGSTTLQVYMSPQRSATKTIVP